jgi:acetyl esterase/lipase
MSSSHHLVDPELAPALDVLPPFHTLGPDTLASLRETVAAGARLQVETIDAAAVVVSEAFIPPSGGQPPVRLFLYRPKAAAAALPALLHIHGGGMVMGLPQMRHGGLVEIVRDLGCLVASVDYRLAPEHPFPAGLDDAYAALAWLHRQAEGLGVDRRRIAVGGESAGGGIAAGLALLARDRGELPIVAQMLTYPMLDDRTLGRALAPHAGAFVWGPEANRFGWTSLLGGAPGREDVSPYAAPARCDRLEGLPPTFIGVGALDLFLDEDLDFAGRLARAGVAVDAHVYAGAFHGFDAVASAAVAQAFRADWRRSLRRAFQSTP